MNAKSDSEKKTLIKMIKIWDLFISKRTLQPVLDSTDFKEAYYRLLTKKDRIVISEYKHSFVPNCLPKSVAESGRFIRGDRAMMKPASKSK